MASSRQPMIQEAGSLRIAVATCELKLGGSPDRSDALMKHYEFWTSRHPRWSFWISCCRGSTALRS